MSKGPSVLRLIKSLARHESNFYTMNPKPYGGSNPYYYCCQCERSMIEASYAGHYEGCAYEREQNAIKSLKKSIQLELHKFLESKAYLGNNYKNYVWFKSGMYVRGLSQIQEAIVKYEKTQQVPTLYP